MFLMSDTKREMVAVSTEVLYSTLSWHSKHFSLKRCLAFLEGKSFNVWGGFWKRLGNDRLKYSTWRNVFRTILGCSEKNLPFPSCLNQTSIHLSHTCSSPSLFVFRFFTSPCLCLCLQAYADKSFSHKDFLWSPIGVTSQQWDRNSL